MMVMLLMIVLGEKQNSMLFSSENNLFPFICFDDAKYDDKKKREQKQTEKSRKLNTKHVIR